MESESYDTNLIWPKLLYSVGVSVTSNFIQYDQDQQHLLPKNVADWVEEDSLERYVSDVVDHFDNEGRLKPFYPVMMLKVLVIGYCIGIRSSRKLDRLLKRDVAFRYLAANQHPDFRTISLFRKNHREEFEHLFVEILRLCREAGMAEMSEVALDGRRVQSDAALNQKPDS